MRARAVAEWGPFGRRQRRAIGTGENAAARRMEGAMMEERVLPHQGVGSRSRARVARRPLVSALLTGALLVDKGLAAAQIVIPERRIHVVRVISQDSFDGVYWAAGKYDQDALARIKRLFRDENDVTFHNIDPALVELMARLQRTLDTTNPLEILSGYRSPTSNARARLINDRVAVNSYHMHGKAADLRVKGVNVEQLRRAALSLQSGGVGTYNSGDFLHIDVGPLRTWS